MLAVAYRLLLLLRGTGVTARVVRPRDKRCADGACGGDDAVVIVVLSRSLLQHRERRNLCQVDAPNCQLDAPNHGGKGVPPREARCNMCPSGRSRRWPVRGCSLRSRKRIHYLIFGRRGRRARAVVVRQKFLPRTSTTLSTSFDHALSTTSANLEV